MEVRIINKFHDKADFTKVYLVGETVTFDDERASYLISLGLVESTKPVAEDAETNEPEVEPAPAEESEPEVAPEAEPVVKEQESEESEPEVAPEAEPVVKEQESEESEPASKKRTTKKDN